MIALSHVYLLAGLFVGWCALQGLGDRGNPRRFSSALFWALLAVAFLFGDILPAVFMGGLVVVMALIAGSGGVRMGSYPVVAEEKREELALRHGNRLFLPALLIPSLTLVGALFGAEIRIGAGSLLGQAQTTVIALGIACLTAFLAALRLTREKPTLALHSARQMLDSIGWAALLPLLLAMLGGVFASAGVGELVAQILTRALPLDLPWVALLAYAFGMVLFTMIMGNAFAAFPVMSIGIALPVLVGVHQASAAPLAAIGMLCGYCGTLMTPMAANYNIVPAALLELRDRHAVIRAQLMTALPLLACNVLLLGLLAL